MVKSNVAIVGPRVRFSAGAWGVTFLSLCSSWHSMVWLNLHYALFLVHNTINHALSWTFALIMKFLEFREFLIAILIYSQFCTYAQRYDFWLLFAPGTVNQQTKTKDQRSNFGDVSLWPLTWDLTWFNPIWPLSLENFRQTVTVVPFMKIDTSVRYPGDEPIIGHPHGQPISNLSSLWGLMLWQCATHHQNCLFKFCLELFCPNAETKLGGMKFPSKQVW